ncbi:hypothetical protein MJO28_017814 [Puccinia striiformis f. sp. tritici]|uniref:hypothetical protein n=1 Tax=Puccinia striiformis f. sp. tritici TaxID=168172 RepID=UPI0020086072|nr:hypothetical protein Pst134EA_011938 [Puccinia striiformis f. sp. tritici]KAH9468314.1 hypothetical protein Pst134EA_011938 [Puccinia striiformis f. sp. tritici]KAI7933110.1 hypothetical protein MJO28_017814 [Puccinia striiformis f. sp. tritici]KAI7958520.1 hypothetical protein MJO29_006737 [Puccinia striiformis f. sp. tritici]KAI9619496.1 hypothetical protein H4Q26_014259 [Puccinia striiformis f. sp. tritici PST-130]
MQFLAMSRGPLVVFMYLIVSCAARNPLFECPTYAYCVAQDTTVSPMKFTFASATPEVDSFTCNGLASNFMNACCVHPTGLEEAKKHKRAVILNSSEFYHQYGCREVEGHPY